MGDVFRFYAVSPGHCASHYTSDRMLLDCLETDVIAPAEQRVQLLRANAVLK